MAGVLRHGDAVAEPAEYLAMLKRENFAAEAWETTYLHVLQGSDPVLEWVRGTALRPVLATLAADDAATFQSEYAALLREAHEKARRDGVVGTDDAMLVERLGHPVRVVKGLAENVKITTPEDLRRARRAWGR